ncbi:MAG TPA: cbb3-type cytochrome c oxidase subunit I [Candidatus Baltobacteraceae bacterium]|nr:cbb3-type cytochrome c oxidase subunit I [Candidatus Baltobacteraceae bacterium]
MSVSVELLRDNVEPEDIAIFSGFTLSATFWLLLSTLVGVLISFKFPYPDFLTSPYLSFGRLRAIHTNDTFYGWASVALCGAALYVAARTSGVALRKKRFAWAGLILFNLAAICGTTTLDLGISHGSQEYREWVWWVILLFLAALVCVFVCLVSTVARRVEREIYISNWYTIGAFVFTILLGITAYVPSYQYGMGQVAVQAFYMHNAVGMWFTFLALGVTYYALPKLLNRPIYSYSLGVLGFWTNLFFYPMIGAHHYEFTPLPWWFQTLAIVFSVGMLVPVWAGTGNFFLTMRYSWETVRRSYALPFIVVGVAYYFLGSTQGTVEAFRGLQALWHLTSYTVGHSHATMYGFITFIAWGAIYALLPRATGKRPSLLITGLHFWLATVGVTAYVVFLSVGGTEQGITWASGNPFIASVDAAAPYWVGRAAAGVAMFAAHLFFAYNVYLMTFAPGRETLRYERTPQRVSA